jgi:hypothetical protein
VEFPVILISLALLIIAGLAFLVYGVVLLYRGKKKTAILAILLSLSIGLNIFLIYSYFIFLFAGHSIGEPPAN